MPAPNVSYAALTDIGLRRPNNEDTFIAQNIEGIPGLIILAAIDGMGGEDGGEVAAEIARRTIIDHLNLFHDTPPAQLIRDAMAYANNEILRHKQVMPRLSGMGCVATAAIVDLNNDSLHIAHVGDSRLYALTPDGTLTKLTHDHSPVGLLEDSGLLTEQEAMHHPRRNRVLRCLGYEPHLAYDPTFIESIDYHLTPGTTLLLCSDGLSDLLTSSQITDIITATSSDSPQHTCQSLIDAALQAGGSDNVTTVIARLT